MEVAGEAAGALAVIDLFIEPDPRLLPCFVGNCDGPREPISARTFRARCLWLWRSDSTAGLTNPRADANTRRSSKQNITRHPAMFRGDSPYSKHETPALRPSSKLHLPHSAFCFMLRENDAATSWRKPWSIHISPRRLRALLFFKFRSPHRAACAGKSGRY